MRQNRDKPRQFEPNRTAGEDTRRFRASLRGILPVVLTVTLVWIALPLMPFGLDIFVEPEALSFSILLVLGQWLIYGAAIVSAVWLVLHIDRASLTRFGLDVDRRWLMHCGVGVIISLLVSTVYYAYGIWRDYFAIYPNRITEWGEITPEVVLAIVGAVLVGVFLANVWEEVVFRAIMLQNFAEGLTARGFSPIWAVGLATVAHAVLFAVYHIPAFFTLAWYTGFIGLLFAIAYLVTGSLGFAIGIHFGRFPMAVLGGEDLGAVEIPMVIEIGVLPLIGYLEVLAIELGLSVVLICAWALLVKGEIGISDHIYDISKSDA